MPRKKRIIGLSSNGNTLALKSAGRETPIQPTMHHPHLCYLLLDTSGSMSGDKLRQAKCGALEFAAQAEEKGYRLGLVTFDSNARLLQEPQNNPNQLRRQLAQLSASGSTNMAAALELATQRLRSQEAMRAIVLVTDGQPDDRSAALAVAERARSLNIAIITIGTEDADKGFLGQIATAEGLALGVKSHELGQGIASAARLLPKQTEG